MGSISGIVQVAGLPRDNATVKLFPASSFGTPPVKGTAFPGSGLLQTVTSGDAHGGDGAYRFLSVSPGSYYAGADWLGTIVWDSFTVQDDLALVSVTTYGAVGDGATDDRAAIQTAIDALSTAGKVVYFPPGLTFLCNVTSTPLTLPSNTTLYGIPGLSKIKLTTTAFSVGLRGIYINGGTTAKANITVQGLQIFTNLADVATNTVVDIAIYIDNNNTTANSDICIRDCEIYNFSGAGINSNNNTAGTNRLRILDNRIHDIKTSTHNNGSNVGKGTEAGASQDSIVRGNVYYNIGTLSTDWAMYSSRDSFNLVVTGNTVFNSAGGIQFFSGAARRLVISNNTFRDMTAGHSIAVGSNADTVSIIGNSFRQNINGKAAISLPNAVTNVVVAGNVIDANGKTQDGFIALNGGGYTGVVIQGNAITNPSAASTVGIFLTGGTSNRVAILGNMIDGCNIGIQVNQVSGGGYTIAHTQIRGNHLKGGSEGVRIIGTDRTVIEGNYIEAASSSGIRFTDGLATNFVVRNNSGGSAAGGISFSGTNGVVAENDLEATPEAGQTNSGNKVRRNAQVTVAAVVAISGATPSVLQGEMFVLTQAGATNVTDFTSGRDGQDIYVIAGDGNSTIKHNAALILLNGAADFVMATNNTLHLARYNSLWYEVGRKA